MKTKLITITTSIVLAISACSKTKVSTNKIGGEEWHVTELSVDGVNEDELPHLMFNDCNAYEESCTGQWKNHEGGKSNFAWQFRNKGKTFEISNQSELTGDHAQDEAVLQCQNFSGVYEVIERKKESMELKSKTTLAYSNQTVVIKLEKE